MRSRPTEAGCEAALLFNAAGGMRAGWRGERDGRWPAWERLLDGTCATPDFYDIDDPSTVGCMLAQVEAAAGSDDVSVEKLRPAGRGFAVFINGSYRHEPMPSRGAALVAAMRALKKGASET